VFAGASVSPAGAALAGVAFAGAEFASDTAGAASAGAAAGSSAGVCNPEPPPWRAGIEINKARTIKHAAATIEIFASTDAVPRGPNAAFEILLVKRAPASVFPGFKSTLPMSTMHEIKTSV